MSKFSFVTGRLLLYNVVLVSALQQCESAISVHASPPSWTSLPPPALSHPSWLSQSTRLSSLSHSNFPLLSVLRVVMYLFQCCSFSSSHLSFPCCIHFWEIVLELGFPRSCLGIPGQWRAPQTLCISSFLPLAHFPRHLRPNWVLLDCPWPVPSEQPAPSSFSLLSFLLFLLNHFFLIPERPSDWVYKRSFCFCLFSG